MTPVSQRSVKNVFRVDWKKLAMYEARVQRTCVKMRSTHPEIGGGTLEAFQHQKEKAIGAIRDIWNSLAIHARHVRAKTLRC